MVSGSLGQVMAWPRLCQLWRLAPAIHVPTLAVQARPHFATPYIAMMVMHAFRYTLPGDCLLEFGLLTAVQPQCMHHPADIPVAVH